VALIASLRQAADAQSQDSRLVTSRTSNLQIR
jgi:hypothetical protein